MSVRTGRPGLLAHEPQRLDLDRPLPRLRRAQAYITRLVPGDGPVTQSENGAQGITVIPVNGPGSGTVTLTPASDGSGWVTVTITPCEDIAALWPAVDYRDFALWELYLNAVSTGDIVSGYFGYLNFDRTLSGEVLFSQQQSMMSALSSIYPSVAQLQGLEVSGKVPHVNWYGGSPSPAADDETMGPRKWAAHLAGQVIPQIHANGGLASYNHPFGTAPVPPLPQSTQDQLVTQVAAAMLPSGDSPAGLGCDILEVGYVLRHGVDLAHHLALWDVMSRNALFFTGNGVSDDHAGLDWTGDVNNWVTCAWSPDTALPDLLAALAAGQAWCGSLAEFSIAGGSSLNLAVDGSCPMGSASLSLLPSRQLTVTAMGIPSGGSVSIWQGNVDYAGRMACSQMRKRSGTTRMRTSTPPEARSHSPWTLRRRVSPA